MTSLRPLVLCLLATLSGHAALAQGRPAAVETAQVSMRELSETITVFGEVIAERESAVATRIAGIVSQVPIRIGARVEAGDVLARMDTERLEIEKARAETERAIAEAGIAVATARLERARLALQRADNLRANSTISDVQYEERASDFAEANGAAQEAEARRALAENAIDRAMYDLDNAVVRAPFAGIVLEVSAQVGQYAASGSAVATLLDLGSLEVMANIPATYVGALAPERDVAARTDTQDRFDLTLVAALPTEFSNTRTRPVVFDFVQDQDGVAVGQPVTLDIPVGETREVVVVPKDALVQSGGGWSAFVNDDGSASPRSVEIGAAIGDSFEVVSGLAPGDEVVVRGNERLRPGQSIMVAGAGGPPGGGRPGGGAEGGGRPGAGADGGGAEGGGRPAAGGADGGGDGQPPAAAGGAPGAAAEPGGPPQDDDGASADAPSTTAQRG